MAREKEFMVYVNGSEHRPIGASESNVESQIQLDNDAPFVVAETMQRVNTDEIGTVQFVATGDFNAPPLVLQWKNYAGRFYTQANQFVPVDSIYGDGRRPHFLKYMLALPGGTIFIINLTNLSAAQMWVYLSHEGYKDYPAESA